jgi:hypothetical protein
MRRGICALLLLLSACRDEPQPPPKAVEPSFDQNWNEDAGKAALLAAGKDQLLAAMTQPKKVITERIVPEEPTPPPVVQEQEEEEPSPKVNRTRREAKKETKKETKSTRSDRSDRGERGNDVCQRHRMRKVLIGKYKWRCRK